MSETNPEQPQPQLGDGETGPEPTTEPQPSGLTDAERAEAVAQVPLHDAPEDRDADSSTGYAVFNRTLGQYVPGVSADKPSKSDATKRVPEGHTAAVVRV